MGRTRLVLSLLLLLPWSSPFAELLQLEGGEELECLVLRTTSTTLVVHVDGKVREIPRKQVRRLSLDRPAADLLRDKLDVVPSSDQEGRFALAAWARQQGLREEATSILTGLLDADPDFAPAHRALDHRLHEGVWYPTEVAWREARGELPFGFGEWLPRARLEKDPAGFVEHQGVWLRAEEHARLVAGEVLQGPAGKATPPPGARGRWSELRTLHYRIVTQVSRRRHPERLAWVLEQACRGFQELTGHQAPQDMGAVIFSSVKAFVEHHGTPYREDAERQAHGYYHPTQEACYLAWHHDEDVTTEILVHEAFHQFCALALRQLQLPVWYEEGLATWLSHVEEQRGTLRLGALRPDFNTNLIFAAKLLRAGTFWSVERMLEEAPRGTGEYYHHLWALHDLLRRHPDYAGALQGWETALFAREQGSPGEITASFREAFRDRWSRMDEDLQAFLEQQARRIPRGRYR